MVLRTAGDWALRSFILIFADEALDDVQERRQHLIGLAATHVILYQAIPTEQYFLYELGNFLQMLNSQDTKGTVGEVLNLTDQAAIPLLDADLPVRSIREMPDPCIIFDDTVLPGVVVGFFDSAVLSEPVEETYLGGEDEPTSDYSLVANFPQKVRLGELVTLDVDISRLESGVGIPDTVGLDDDILIRVVPQKCFTLADKKQGLRILKLRDADSKLSDPFKLYATTAGSGRIYVIAYHNAKQICKLNLIASVSESSTTGRSEQHCTLRTDDISMKEPDLRLEIHETRQAQGHLLRFAVAEHASGTIRELGQTTVKLMLPGYSRDILKRFDGTPLTNIEAAKVSIERMGLFLFSELFPQELRDFLWDKRSQLKTLQVVSTEPWIPWELCRLASKKNGEPELGKFLCEEFALTRWFPDVNQKQHLPLSELGAIFPKAKSRKKILPAGKEEQKYLANLASDDINVRSIPANKIEVLQALHNGSFNGFHFAGHGNASSADPNQARICLEASDLRPEEVAGEYTKFDHGQPFVFFNCCNSGISGQSLTSIGGWAARFITSQASAFIGAYWSVYDETAFVFMKTLYDQLIQGSEIGHATLKARQAAKSTNDPLSWLAYTVYANPLAKIKYLKEEATDEPAS